MLAFYQKYKTDAKIVLEEEKSLNSIYKIKRQFYKDVNSLLPATKQINSTIVHSLTLNW